MSNPRNREGRVEAMPVPVRPNAPDQELRGILADEVIGRRYRHLDDLDAVVESDTCEGLRLLICAFEPPPGFRCGDYELEHHQLGCVGRRAGSRTTASLTRRKRPCAIVWAEDRRRCAPPVLADAGPLRMVTRPAAPATHARCDGARDRRHCTDHEAGHCTRINRSRERCSIGDFPHSAVCSL